MLDEELGRLLVQGDLVRRHARVFRVGVLEGALFERTDDVHRHAVFNQVLAKDDIAAEQAAGDLVLGPAHGTLENLAASRGGGDRGLERPQVHADVNAFVLHAISPSFQQTT